MENLLKHAVNIFCTVCLIVSLSGCASIMEYWTVDESAAQADSGAAAGQDSEEASDTVQEEAVSEKDQSGDMAGKPAENIVSGSTPSKAPASTALTVASSQNPAPADAAFTAALADARNKAANAEAARQKAETELAAAKKQTAEAEAARKNAEADAAAAKKRIAELEAAPSGAPVTASVSTNAETEAAQKRAAEAEAAQQKAAAELAATKKRATEAEAAQKKAATELAAAKKQAAEAEAARKKAEADAAAAKKQAATDLIAAKKQAAEAEAARQKAEADAAALRKKAEEVSLQSMTVSSVQVSDAGQETSDIPRPETAFTVQNSATQAVATEVDVGMPVDTPVTLPPAPDAILPKYYRVTKWPTDCFWKIAELVYDDPYRWPILYEANRSKLADPENPDLLDAGIVLEIPSINGERREGYYAE
jgi:hypothetical protein